MIYEFTLTYLRTCSELNVREHWRSRQKRAKQQRFVAKFNTIGARRGAWPIMPYRIVLTRIAPGRLDSDNLAGSMKHVRDGVADALGIDDGDPRLVWEYGQHRGPSGEYAVDIVIEERPDAGATTA